MGWMKLAYGSDKLRIALNRVREFGFHKTEIFWLAEELSAFKEGFCSMELHFCVLLWKSLKTILLRWRWFWYYLKIKIRAEDHFSVSGYSKDSRFPTTLQKVLLVQPVLGAAVVTVRDVQLLLLWAKAPVGCHVLLAQLSETQITAVNSYVSQSSSPRFVRRGSEAACLLRLRIRILTGTGMPVCCDFCVLSSRGPCVGLITLPREWMWCV
jgi:hypothetical protein